MIRPAATCRRRRSPRRWLLLGRSSLRPSLRSRRRGPVSAARREVDERLARLRRDRALRVLAHDHLEASRRPRPGGPRRGRCARARTGAWARPRAAAASASASLTSLSASASCGRRCSRMASSIRGRRRSVERLPRRRAATAFFSSSRASSRYCCWAPGPTEEVRAEAGQRRGVVGVPARAPPPRPSPVARDLRGPPPACAGTGAALEAVDAPQLPALRREEHDRGQRGHLVAHRDVDARLREPSVLTLTATKSCERFARPGVARRWSGPAGRTSRTTRPRSRRSPACRPCAPSSAPRRSCSPIDAAEAAARRAPRARRRSSARARGRSAASTDAGRSRRAGLDVGVEQAPGTSGRFQNDSGCHCTPTTKRRPGISTPSTTPSAGQRAETTRPSPSRATAWWWKLFTASSSRPRMRREPRCRARPRTSCARRERGPRPGRARIAPSNVGRDVLDQGSPGGNV